MLVIFTGPICFQLKNKIYISDHRRLGGRWQIIGPHNFMGAYVTSKALER